MFSPPPLTFCSDELQRALGEQLFAISSYSITVSTPSRAVAVVTLLDGQIVSVGLTSQGYSIDETSSIIFETIEDLLSSVSAFYERKRQEALIQKLEKLA